MCYVYLIGWTKLNTWYCGVRYRKGCSPSDLWKTYFSSSKHVAKFRKEHGEPDHIEILKEFDDSSEARLYEEHKLKEFDVLKKENWLNKNIGGIFFGQTGPLSNEHKLKISNTGKGKKRPQRSEEWKRKQSDAKRGKRLSEITKLKLSVIRLGKKRGPMTEEQKIKLSIANKGNIVSEETRRKISNANNGKKRSIKAKENYVIAQAKRLSIDPNMLSGEKNPMFGKKHSEETKTKLKAAWIRRKQKILSNSI